MRGSTLCTTVIATALAVGCGGGSTPPAQAPEEPTTAEASPPPEPEPEPAMESSEVAETAETSEEEPASSEPAEPEEAPPPKPEFPEGASVQEAMDAVPQGSERINIDPAALGEPLQQAELYEPCNVGAQHFELQVAIWNGRAVGVDVETRNKKLAECVEEQVRAVEWPDKVESLNTVSYSM